MGRGVIEAAAVEVMVRGWAVFPVKGKKPLPGTHGFEDASTETRMAGIWFERHPDRGLALATGTASGVWVLDLDSHDAIDRIKDLQDAHSPFPKTVTTKTRNGFHIFFRMPENVDIRNGTNVIGDGVDVRGTGGYAVLSPSPHPDGGHYGWVPGRSPEDLAVAHAPQWLIDLVKTRPVERGEVTYSGDELVDALISGWHPPQRHELALGFGGWAAKNSLPRERAIGIIEEVAAGAGDEEAQDRVTAVTTSFDRVKAGEDVAGYRTLETILPADALEVFQDFGPQRNNGGGSHMANGQPASNGELTAPVMELTDRGVLDRIKDEKLQPLSVVATPWPTWNRVCRGAGGGEGLAHGWHVLIGASSGAGKSLAAINLAAAAMRVGEHVCLISLEMSQQEVLTRLMSIYSGQEARKLEHGRQFSTEAWEAATEELQEARGSIRVNPDPISRLDQIAAVIERYHGEGCRTFIIDYLQLAWVRSAETMVHQITEVSHTIRGLAREHRLLSIGLSQINRQTSAGGELRKEGLLGGSSLENDADQVMLIGRQEQHGQGAYRAEVKLDKNRHGPPVSWAMILDTKTLRMRESMPDEEASWSVG